jgi:hypothetical protein
MDCTEGSNLKLSMDLTDKTSVIKSVKDISEALHIEGIIAHVYTPAYKKEGKEKGKRKKQRSGPCRITSDVYK